MASAPNKKYRLKALPATLMLAVLIAGCILSAALISNGISTEPVGAELPSSDITSTVSGEGTPSDPITPPEPKTARLIGVGDNLIHQAIYSQAKQRAGEGENYNFTAAYENVQHYLDLADLRSINQETVMVAEAAPSSYPYFNSPTELGDHLVGMGFEVFNLANNHIYDMTASGLGAAALTSYLSYWGTQHPDALTTGLYRDEADAENIRAVEINGITFAFIGLTEWTNGIPKPANTDSVLVLAADEARIQTQIEAAREIADVVVVNAHWGTEYTYTPTDAQRALAEKMVNWGADVILGHHPHVIQPVEYITREDGTSGIVAYSLGNFISAQDTGYRMIGGSLDLTVEKDPITGEVTLAGARFVPIITQYEGNYGNVRNYTFEEYTAELAEVHGVRSGKTPGFSVEFIQEQLDEVIAPEFLSSYNDAYTSAAPGPLRYGNDTTMESSDPVTSDGSGDAAA